MTFRQTNLPPPGSAPTPAAASTDIALSLLSHTNVGKTTLARTLLQRDVGDVRDEAHVTQEASVHTLVETAGGERLLLWDTPGFGDSIRLARRLALPGAALRWFLLEVWDRFRDRGFWHSQRAARNVVEQADVVLYLVDASQAPEDAGYLDAELTVLGLLGKPVLALLNQLGVPLSPADDAAEVQRWRERMAQAACVQAVLPLDAFNRCWVQESVLLDAVAAALPPFRRPAMQRLREAWLTARRQTWQASMSVLAQRLARAALDRQPVRAAGLAERLGEMGAGLVRRIGRMGAHSDGQGEQTDAPSTEQRARNALAERLDQDIRDGTDRLIALHGLEGRAAGEVLARLAQHFAVTRPLDETRTGLWGAVVTGALTGLKADVLSGGLTMGGGLLAGGLLGGLAGIGAARGVNKVRGVSQPVVAWSDAVLDDLARAALLGYLAVAHHGRGRGAWQCTQDAAAPAFWQQAVDQAAASALPELHAFWAQARQAAEDSAGAQADDGNPGGAGAAGETPDVAAGRLAALARAIEPWLSAASERTLVKLYPHAQPDLASPGAANPFTAGRDSRAAAPAGTAPPR